MSTILGAPPRFERGLHEVAPGCHAWLQPNGNLGESNAGLVVGDGASLLVDTLWDLRLTRAMLDATAPLTADAPIRTLVNTHSDGDHCWGNELVEGAEIVATRAAAAAMTDESPRELARLAGAGRRLGFVPGLRGIAGFLDMVAKYDFGDVRLTLPTRTFEGELTLEAGGREVRLLQVGPAHTEGDLIVHVPDAGVVYSADVMFVGVTPIMWVGPVSNWLAALDLITTLQPAVVVPGHGPATDLAGVAQVRAYWTFVEAAVRDGRSAKDILRSEDFRAGGFADWEAPERLAVNVAMIERGLRGQAGRVSSRERIRLIAQMGALA